MTNSQALLSRALHREMLLFRVLRYFIALSGDNVFPSRLRT